MKPFFSPDLVRQLPLAVISGGIIAMVCFKSTTVHLPFFINVLLSFGLGWLQPRKGWVLALVQVLSLLVAYSLFSNSDLVVATDARIAKFTTYMGIFPTLTGAFVGALLGRTLKENK